MKKTLKALAFTALAAVGISVAAVAQTVNNPSGSVASIINNYVTNIFNDASAGSALLNGCQVSWKENLVYTVSACQFIINDTTYTASQTDVTLTAADGSNPRIDVIIANTASAITKVDGTPAAEPSEPSIDPGSQIKLALVLVPAGATEPSGATNTILYAENLGTGGGEGADCTNSGASITCNSTNNPRAGTKDIEATNLAVNAYAQLALAAATDITDGNPDRLVFHIRSKATWPAGRGIRVQLLSSGVIKGQQITLINGSPGPYGFFSSITANYQQISIPVEDFALPAGTTVNQIRFIGFGGTIGFYIDDVKWQDGGTSFNTSSFLTQTQADARYRLASEVFEVNAGNVTGATTVNFGANGGLVYQWRGTLTGNVTFTFSNPIEGGRYLLMLTQDGTGSRTVTWPATVVWSGGVAPTLTTTAGYTDLCTLAYSGAEGGSYFAACNLNHNR